MPDGRIEPRQVERFREIGAWLKQYGESIYGTRGGPFCGAGVREHAPRTPIYLHVLKWYGDKVLPAADCREDRRPLGPDRRHGRGASRPAARSRSACRREHRQELDTIVALELDGPAIDLKPVPGPLRLAHLRRAR